MIFGDAFCTSAVLYVKTTAQVYDRDLKCMRNVL